MSQPSQTTLTFEEIIAPVTREEFFERYWNKAPLIISRGDRGYYGDLYRLQDVDRSIFGDSHCQDDHVSLIPPQGSDEEMTTHAPSDLAYDEMYRAFNKGYTIRFASIQSTWSPVARLSAAMCEAFSARVNVNCYLTPASSQGFKIHIDTHDVFILQTHGAKDWFVYETDDYALPLKTLDTHHTDIRNQYKSPLTDDEVKLKHRIRLEAGDLLFMPRGVPHKAIAAPGEASLHLTFGIHPLYWVEYAKAAMEMLAVHNRSFREPLPVDFVTNPEVAASMSAHFAEALKAAMAQNPSFERTTECMV
ncbi:MAG: cupin domain-containing protein, partial [Acidobacteriota bacterium]